MHTNIKMKITKYKKAYFVLSLFATIAFFCLPKISQAFCEDGAESAIEQHGITWTFDHEYQCGQFVNGDYWVMDAGSGVKIINITPGYTDTTRAMNGSMINPSTAIQGYDGFMNYDQTKNVGIGISSATPLILSGKSSLVSTISNETPGDQGGGNHVSYIRDASVLTSLDTTPSPGSFRPGISGAIKNLYNESSLQRNLLKKMTTPSGQNISTATLNTYANYFQMVWLDHNGGWTSRYMHPTNGLPDNYYYAPYMANAALMLHLDFSDEEKENLLINYIQSGLDLYSFLDSGASGWPPDGGHSNGRKWPILFAGLMLNDAEMKNIGAVSGDYLYADGHGSGNPPTDYKYFGEDGQTFYVAQSDVDITNGPTWNPDTRSAPNYPYSVNMIGMPEWGIRYSTDQSRSDSQWTTNYRTIGSAMPSWAGFAMAAYFMNAKTSWNYNPFFDYIDRYMSISKGDPDPFGFNVVNQQAGARPGGLVGAMYDTYRGDYGSQESLRFDVDNSSTTNTTDALLTLRNSLGLSMASTAWQTSATTGDVDCNGVSNSTDALLILRYSLGLSMGSTAWCE